jgi:iron complex transport system permease protein
MRGPGTRAEAAAALLPAEVGILRVGPSSIRVHRRVAMITVTLLVAVLVAAGVSMMVGDSDLSFGEVVGAFFGGGTRSDRQIVLDWRLTRTLLGVLGGAALGLSGAIFQSMTRNPLGSPDIIGFSSGAYTGALLAIGVIGSQSGVTTIGALLGGMATALLVYLLAFKRGVHGLRFIVVGIAVSAALNSLNSYLLIRGGLEESVSAAAWGAGTLNDATWGDITVLTVSFAVLVPFTVARSRNLQVLEMGDDPARALGVRCERERLIWLVLGVGFVAVITALAGPIAFVALAAPQVARRVTGAVGPGLLPAAVMGALLLTASDVLARVVIAPGQLAVGIVTSCLGGAYLLFLLVTRARAR